MIVTMIIIVVVVIIIIIIALIRAVIIPLGIISIKLPKPPSVAFTL